MTRIPFNVPLVKGRELDYIREAIANRHLAGNGPFTAKCHAWLEAQLGVGKVLLTHSCTAALEMAAILLDVGPGDEVIMPSFTFVSTANAFVLRGATPVFVDIREDTCNLDESLIENAITPRTRAIVPVHYAGVACDMDPILDIARRHGLLVIEDAAQGILSTYRGRPLGSLGHLAALSFHETKNVVAGEGGALIVNDPRWSSRSEIVWGIMTRSRRGNRKAPSDGRLCRRTAGTTRICITCSLPIWRTVLRFSHSCVEQASTPCFITCRCIRRPRG
jgi:dTDP-4-amino-4,6-dideoxygalactose transaminase